MVMSSHLKAVLVRACLLLHFVLVVWRVTESKNVWYWLLLTAIIPFLLEGIFTVIRRDGIEWKMFSVCFFFYLAATLPGIWLLELYKTEVYQSGNFSRVEDISISGVELPVRLSPDTWVLVVEELMLYLMILGRWMLPRGDVGREQLTHLLFGFIGIASDIMELFSLFDEDPHIRDNTVLTYVILGVWTLSILQFTLTFATAHRSRRSRGLQMNMYYPSASRHRRAVVVVSSNSGGDPEGEDEEKQQSHRKSVLRMELFATFLSLFMQDGPFLGVRLYTMITYHVITYSLVFFTAKNVLVILLLVYKIFLLLHKICCPSRRKHEDDKEDLTLEQADLDYEKIITNPNRTATSDHRESWDLRKRRDKKQKEKEEEEEVGEPGGTFEQDFLDPDMGKLREAIEGPATPATNTNWGKKYIVQDEAEQGPSEDAEKSQKIPEDPGKEQGVDNLAFEPSPRTSRQEASPGRKDSAASSNKTPSRKVSPAAQNQVPDKSTSSDSDDPKGRALGRNEPLGWLQKDPGLGQTPGEEGPKKGEPYGWNGPNDNQSPPTDQKTPPSRNKPLPFNGVPPEQKKSVDNKTPSDGAQGSSQNPTPRTKKHVSIIRVSGTHC